MLNILANQIIGIIKFNILYSIIERAEISKNEKKI